MRKLPTKLAAWHWKPFLSSSQCLFQSEFKCEIFVVVVISSNFSMNKYTIAFIWRENVLGYLSVDIICSEKRTVFRERSSNKTVSFQEQIMSKDKYPRIFSQPNWLNWGYCVHYPSVLKIGEYPRIFPSFSWGIFAHVTCLDQSRSSVNIWWIIKYYIERIGIYTMGSFHHTRQL